MGDFSAKVDVEKLISYSDDLMDVLKEKKDINNFTQFIHQSKTLRSSIDDDFHRVQSLIQDYRRKIDVCKRKTEEAKSEVVADEDIEGLQKELEEELENERLLKEELRFTNEINDLDSKRISVEERKKVRKKLEQDELRTQRMLSMYATVTNVIPNLDEQLKISGHIVYRDENLVKKFEYDQNRTTAFDTCNGIWKTMNIQ